MRVLEGPNDEDLTAMRPSKSSVLCGHCDVLALGRVLGNKHGALYHPLKYWGMDTRYLMPEPKPSALDPDPLLLRHSLSLVAEP